MTNKDGITHCTKCETRLEGDEIGYCSTCLKLQEIDTENIIEFSIPTDPVEIHKYAEDRRQEIRDFIKDSRFQYEYIGLSEVNERIHETKHTIYGILSAQLAASLDYSLVREVAYVNPVTDKRRKWLQDYWIQKYEIELKHFDFEVGLRFSSWYESYYGYGMYESRKVYDYPSTLIQAYVIRYSKEGGN